jgi:hypothetical protein
MAPADQLIRIETNKGEHKACRSFTFDEIAPHVLEILRYPVFKSDPSEILDKTRLKFCRTWWSHILRGRCLCGRSLQEWLFAKFIWARLFFTLAGRDGV